MGDVYGWANHQPSRTTEPLTSVGWLEFNGTLTQNGDITPFLSHWDWK